MAPPPRGKRLVCLPLLLVVLVLAFLTRARALPAWGGKKPGAVMEPPKGQQPQGGQPGIKPVSVNNNNDGPALPADPNDSSGVARLFEQTMQAIQTKVNNGEEATPQIIAHILRDTTTKAQSLLIKASIPAVKEECLKGYMNIGWDFNKNKSVSREPPTLQQVLDFLRNTSTKIRSLVKDTKKDDNNSNSNNMAAPASVEPTKQELDDLAEACNRLWQLDFNRLNPESGDYKINLQSSKRFGDQTDRAKEPLFSYVNNQVLKRPTFAAFVALLDNYVAETGKSERVTDQETAENTKFINAIFATPCIRYLHRYLTLKKLAPADPLKFKLQLYSIWFQLYGRTRGINDSSGFEHVFVGETKDGRVVGLHNWIQIYLQEKAGKLNYKGYFKGRGKGGRAVDQDDYEQLVSINFDWNGMSKDSSTIFVGTSPEFEVALYTLCFLTSPEQKVVVNLGPYRSAITTFKLTSHGENYVGSSFPGLP